MAGKAAKSKDADEEGKKKSGKPKLVIGVICIALAGGAYMLGSKSAAPAADVGPTTTTTIPLIDGCKEKPEGAVPETVVDLPEMSINLADGHYLRTAVSLGLCKDVVLATPDEFHSAPAKDIVVETLSGAKMEVLSDPAGRDAMKQALTDKLSAAYPGVVYEVFFVEFVMQ